MTTSTKSKNGVNATEEVIELPQMQINQMELTLVGVSPLIMHRWSEKAKKEMLDKQMKKAKQAKTAKDPVRDYVESMYWLGGMPKELIKKSGKLSYDKVQELAKNATFGFPSVAFKSAAVGAVAQISGLTKVFARGAFHVNMGQEFIEIESDCPTMREDMVRIGQGVADIRYRGEFSNWRATISVSYNAAAISAEQIANLFNTAGFAIGVGEWRPEKNGSNGMFVVE